MIRGNWSSRRVWVNGIEITPEWSQAVWDHSPNGFCWGYSGSGPAQLALALLLHLSQDKDFSVKYHQQLKSELIAGLPQTDFDIDTDKVISWIRARREEDQAKE